MILERLHTTNEAVKRIAVREIRENNDKKGRECNIVVYGIDEEKDAEEEIPLILAKLDVSVEVDGIRRMGRDKKEGKNRLVWVKLGSKKERNSVLDNAKKLRNSDSPDLKNVFINPDLTVKQKEADKALRAEMWQRREKGENVIIHRSKLITVNREVRKVRSPKPIQNVNQSSNSNQVESNPTTSHL